MHQPVERIPGFGPADSPRRCVPGTFGLAAVLALLATGTYLPSVPALGQDGVSIGTNFTGSSFGQSGFAPPDTMGAVGPGHVVELINGQYAVYDKQTGANLTRSTLDTFWSIAGAPLDSAASPNFRFDPRLLYDASSQRWFAASVDNSRQANNFLVGVSKSSNPLDGWTALKIDADTDDTRWADFPVMGVNGDGLFLTASMFDIPGDATNEATNVHILALPKAGLLASSPTVSGATMFESLTGSSTGFTVQPVVDLDGGGMPMALLSSFSKSSGTLKASEIDGPITSPTLDTANRFISVTARAAPPSADQPGAKANISTNDSRFSGNVVRQNGGLWAVHTVTDAATGNAALQWYEIDATTYALRQEGLISDPALDLYFPSIAVNEFGDVVIGFSGSSETQFVSSYAAVGDTHDGLTSFGDLLLLKAGADDYERLDGSNRNRWGDYSATVVDPSDPTSFWTFQEFVSGDNTWSVQVSQLRIPEPASMAVLAGIGGLLLLRRRCR